MMVDDIYVLAVLLTLAHVLADFVFQTQWMADKKRDPKRLLLHILVVAIMTAAVIGPQHWQLIAVIASTHFMIDLTKAWVDRKGTWQGFLIDQAAHVAVILVVAATLTISQDELLLILVSEPLIGAKNLVDYIIILTGLIVAVRASGFLTGLFVARFPDDVPKKLEGLENGGATIGHLERFLAYVLIVSGNPTAVGFLIAAKSILRFGDITNRDERAVAEYVIIGTLISFSCAISVGLTVRWLLTPQ